MMMNCFCGMADWWKALSLIFSWDHCQRSWPSQIFGTSWTGFESSQLSQKNLKLLLGDNMDEESQEFSNIKSSAPGCCLIFCQIQLVVTYKSVAYKKRVLYLLFLKLLPYTAFLSGNNFATLLILPRGVASGSRLSYIFSSNVSSLRASLVQNSP